MKIYVLIAGLLLAVFAQAQTGQEKPAEPQQEIVTPYQIANIAEAMQATNDVTREATKLANDSIRQQEFVQRFLKISYQYRDSISDSAQTDFSNYTLWELKDQKRIWTEFSDDLSAFSEDLKIYQTEISDQILSIDKLHKKWLVTKAAADTTDITQELITPMQLAIEQTDTANHRLKIRLESVLVLDNKVASEQTFVKSTLAEISTIRNQQSKLLLAPDSPPFFTAIKHKSSSGNIFYVFSSSIKKNAKSLEVYFKENIVQFILHFLAFISFYLLMWYIKRMFVASALKNEKEFALAERVLRVPIVNAIVLALVSLPLFYESFPEFMINWLIVVAILPIMVLLPRIFKQNMRRFFIFVSLLILFDKVVAQFAEDVYHQRNLAIILDVIGVTGFAYFLWPGKRFYTLLKDAKHGVLLFLMQLFTVVMAFAIYCNLAGIYHLSILLTRGVIHSFTVGLILFLGINILRVVLLFLYKKGAEKNVFLLQKYKVEIQKWSFILISIFAYWFWARTTLRGFALLTPFNEGLQKLVQTSWQFGEITLSVQNIVDFVSILALFILLANIINVVLREEILKRFDMRRGVPLAMAVLTRYVILFLGFVLAMSSAGISLERLSLLVGALGVGIGFGLQSIVSNFVSGLVIIFERPVHLGDIVTAGQAEGEVVAIGLRSSRIRTWDGAEVILPNNDLIAKEVTNWTFSDKKRRLTHIVLIDSGPSPREVKTVLDQVMQNHKGLLRDPMAQSYFLGYENNALKFKLLMWLNKDLLGTPSDVLLDLHDALAEKDYKAYIPVQKIEWQEKPLSPEENRDGKVAEESPENKNQKK